MDARRVIATDQAVELIEKLKVEHGQLMFHQRVAVVTAAHLCVIQKVSLSLETAMYY